MMQSTADRYDYQLRIQVQLHTRDAMLLAYLRQVQQHPLIPHHDMVLMALRSYWLPFAYDRQMLNDDHFSDPGFKHLVKSAIGELRGQAQSLHQHFLADRSGQHHRRNRTHG
jgi:hypothetical protein